MNRLPFDLQSLIYKTRVLTRNPVCRRHFNIIDTLPINHILFGIEINIARDCKNQIMIYDWQFIFEGVSKPENITNELYVGYLKHLLHDGHLCYVKELLNSDFLPKPEIKRFFFNFVCRGGHYDCIKFALEEFKINGPFDYNQESLMNYIERSPNPTVEGVKLFQKHGSYIHHCGSEGKDLLIIAAKMGLMDIAQYSIDQGVSQFSTDYSGKTAWQNAADGNHLELTIYLCNSYKALGPHDEIVRGIPMDPMT